MFSTEISLQQRLEYISRAILSSKSSSCVSSLGADGEFLHELEEKMEVFTHHLISVDSLCMSGCCNSVFVLQVVRIQVQIQETLRRQYSQHPSVQGAITQLDSELMDITKVREKLGCTSNQMEAIEVLCLKMFVSLSAALRRVR